MNVSQVSGLAWCCGASQPLAGMLVSVPGHVIQLTWLIGSSGGSAGFVQVIAAGWFIQAPAGFALTCRLVGAGGLVLSTVICTGLARDWLPAASTTAAWIWCGPLESVVVLRLNWLLELAGQGAGRVKSHAICCWAARAPST